MMFAASFAQASTTLWTFTPLTPTTLAIPANDIATVRYQITNQSKTSHSLLMNIIHGITQMTTTGNCPNPFILGYQQSCILNLTVDGSALSSDITGGPVICEQGNPNQCYQPGSENTLRISKAPAVYYTLGGSAFGLLGTLILKNSDGNTLVLNTDGTFAFANALPPRNSYAVTIQSQPATQTCTLSHNTGVIAHANITNMIVNCSTHTQTIGGTVSGLTPTESVVLQNNGGNNLLINNNGTFTFSTPVAQGATYNVSVLTHPATQTCTVTHGNGTISTANINTVQVTCATNTHKVGGTVSNLSGTLVLQNNGMDDLSINNNGAFIFPTSVAEGANYQVTILTQPAGQTCSVAQGSGTMGGADVSQVRLTCLANTTTLTTSLADVRLSVTGLTEYGVTGTPNSGLARILTITNTGGFPATNLAVTSPNWPTGTSSVTTCGNTLAAGDSCTMTITPGNTATSNGTNPCSNGTAPIPGLIQITANNAHSLSVPAVVLNYGCIYQGGYVYAFDDTTPNTQNVGGKIIATTNQAVPYPHGAIWSSNGNSGNSGDVAYDAIYSISETSTLSLPHPNNGQVAGQTACDGAIDGLCNTKNIYTYYQYNATGAPVNFPFYAAGLCKQVINGYTDWYLPSICEMGYGSPRCGSASSPTLQNMQSNLVDLNNLRLLAGFYWTSTQQAANPQTGAWYHYFDSDNNSLQDSTNKGNQMGVRCTRRF